MQLDRAQVVLRPRTSWEAMELGTALMRAHARPLWRAWFIASVPLLVLLNVAGWAIDQTMLAALAMWWLKPLFDRLPLFVLSRAVFGAVPTLRETLAAPRTFGWRSLLRDLTWARLSPVRSVAMPVHLLEGVAGERLALRRRAIIGSGGGAATGLTLLCLHFDLILSFAVVMVGLLFVPVEFLSESFRAMWALLFEDPPKWAQVLLNVLAWAATSFVEPFYVGAGFAFYLNRRTQLEAWDLELAFRGMAARVRALAPALAVLLALALPLRAQQAPAPEKPRPQRTLSHAMVPATQATPDPRFERAVAQAYRDPLLKPTRKVVRWERIRPARARQGWRMPLLDAGLGGVARLLMWMVAGALALWLLLRLPRWWPALWGRVAPLPAQDGPVEDVASVVPEALPADIATAARALWTQGRPRAALAMLYRGSVLRMSERAQVALPPGATEAQCLRASRALPEAADREAFAQVVRAWQYAAYASRLPGDDAFERLVAGADARFGWSA